MITIVIILSALSFLQFIFNIILLNRCSQLKIKGVISCKEKDDIIKEKDRIIMQKDTLLKQRDLIPGDRVIFKQNLTWKLKEVSHSFQVLYEADVIEVSNTDIKVTAYDFSGKFPDDVLNEPSHEKALLAYMENKWIERNIVSKLVSSDGIRDSKINRILK